MELTPWGIYFMEESGFDGDRRIEKHRKCDAALYFSVCCFPLLYFSSNFLSLLIEITLHILMTND